MAAEQWCCLCSKPIQKGDRVILGREEYMPEDASGHDIGMYCGIVMHIRCYEKAGSIMAGFIKPEELRDFLKGA
jgi:hypothetical protein